MPQKLTEDNLAEQPAIDWFKELGYDYKFGPDISPGGLLLERKNYKEVILIERLKQAIRRLNQRLNEKEIEEAIEKLIRIAHPDLEILNKEVYDAIRNGVVIKKEGKEQRGENVKLIDFENPLNNEFLVVNQFAVEGKEKVRRPDIVVFINGLPIAVIELKNPLIEEADIFKAYKQIEDYKQDIPELFKYNQIIVISDLLYARYGTISSSFEWFKVWRGIEDKDEKLEGKTELEILIKGIFNKIRLLDIIKNFIVFEADSEKEVSKYTKKICLYHQYFGVNKAIKRTLEALKPKGNGKIGILWHTQGSGKTLSIVFYVNKIKEIEELNSPTIVILTDRNDLDEQFWKTFLRTGYSKIVKRAESIKDLKDKLRNAGAEIIFTTIQKFQGDEFEVLSERNNIIVIADEAHRSQYAKLAANAKEALPNASFMGITATPLTLVDRNTIYVFGDYIDVYTMNRAVEDKAIVPIYYESRLVPLHLTNMWIDEDYDRLMAEVPDPTVKEILKRKFAKLEQAVSAEDRLRKIAEDIVNHFKNRGILGKAMVVTISRKVAVKMYKLISSMMDPSEVAVVISGIDEFKDEVQEERRINELERKFKNPEDPLKMVIVCDMWLTGFDVPCLTTMYFDKPLKGHTLMQAIARVNRIFRDKEGGLIVDYIGIADDLKKALSIYTDEDWESIKKSLVPLEDVTNKMLEKYDIVKSMLSGVDYKNWKYLEGKQLAELLAKAVNIVITDLKTGSISEDKKKKFLDESLKLIKLHALVMPNKEAYQIIDDVKFFKAVRSEIFKMISVEQKESYVIREDFESVIKELINKSIAAEGIIDIFKLKGKDKLDISILDEKFLEEVRKIKYLNVVIELLRKLLNEEIKSRMRKNKIRFKKLLEILEEIIEKYENRVINSAKIIEELINLAKEIKKYDEEAKKIDLSEEELAFYDILSTYGKGALKDEEIKHIVKQLVKEIRRDITIDWNKNEIIKARIRERIKILLLQRNINIEKTNELIPLIFEQAEGLWGDDYKKPVLV